MQRYRSHAGVLGPYPEREATDKQPVATQKQDAIDEMRRRWRKSDADADHACVMRTRLLLRAMSATPVGHLISYKAATSEQDWQKSRGSFGIPARL
jgi:hypothetical protein